MCLIAQPCRDLVERDVARKRVLARPRLARARRLDRPLIDAAREFPQPRSPLAEALHQLLGRESLQIAYGCHADFRHDLHSRFARDDGIAECTPNLRASYDAAQTTLRSPGQPTTTGLPLSAGSSRCSTEA